MLVNPDIKEWFDRLQGRPPGAGGSAPRGQILPNYGLEAAQGIVKPGSGVFGFNAPAIAGRYQPHPPAPNPPERGPTGIAPAGVSPSGAGARDLGGGAIAAGIGRLGQGVEGALGDLAAKQKAKQADLDAASGVDLNNKGGLIFGRPPTPPARPDTPLPPSRPLLSQPGVSPSAGTGDYSPVGNANIAAFRYNNPGNISLPMAGWDRGGEIVGLKNQPGYAKFPDMQTGMDAFQHRVQNYIDSRGLNTISALNSVYATDPHWAAGVASASGLSPSTPLDTSNPEQMRALQKGILTQEMGARNADQVLSSLANGASAQSASNAPPVPPARPTEPAQPSGPTQTAPGQPQTGPAYSDETWNNRPKFDYGGQGGAATVPVPPPPYLPGQQGMAQPPTGINDQSNPLAAALAQGGDQYAPPIDQSALLALALSQGASPDFGGFSGLFG